MFFFFTRSWSALVLAHHPPVPASAYKFCFPLCLSKSRLHWVGLGVGGGGWGADPEVQPIDRGLLTRGAVVRGPGPAVGAVMWGEIQT